MHRNQIRAGIEIVVPNLLKNVPPAEQLTGVAHHEFEKLKFHRQKLDRATPAAGLASDHVEFEIADSEHEICAGRASMTSQKDLKAGNQFGRRERLHQVIITPGAQTHHPIIDIAQRTHHEDRGLDPGIAQGCDDRQTVASWQESIQCDRIESFRLGKLNARPTIKTLYGMKPTSRKAGGDFCRRIDIIFNDQNAGHLGPQSCSPPTVGDVVQIDDNAPCGLSRLILWIVDGEEGFVEVPYAGVKAPPNRTEAKFGAGSPHTPRFLWI